MPDLQKNKFLILGTCLAFFILNLILKFWFIDAGDISGDEPFTIFHAQKSWSDLFELFPKENNPPLHFILIKIWISWFGIGPFAVRSLSVIFSSLTVIYIFLIAKKQFSFQVGIIASVLFTYSNFHTFFAHEARSYSLLVFLLTTTYYFYINYLSTNSKKYLWLFVFSGILLLYSHFFGLIALGSIFSYHLIRYKKNIFKHIKPFLLIAIGFIPYLPILLTRFTKSSSGTWLEQPAFSEPYNVLVKFSNKPVIAVIFLAIILNTSIVYLLKKDKPFRSKIQFFQIQFLLPILGIFALSFFLPMYLDRYLIICSIPFYISISAGIVYLFQFSKNKVVSKLGLLLTIPMIATFSVKTGVERDQQEIYGIIERNRSEKSLLIIQPKWLDKELSYHLEPSIFTRPENFHDLLQSNGIQSVYSTPKIDQSYDPIITVNLVHTHPNAQLLKSTYFKIETYSVKGWEICVWKKK